MLRIRVEYPSTQRLDAEVLEKFYDDLVPDLPRVPYVDEASARATVEAMQALGPPLPKVDLKTLYDNGLLKGLEAEGFLDKIVFLSSGKHLASLAFSVFPSNSLLRPPSHIS